MILNRNDMKQIQEILEKFSGVDVFELEQEGGNGIGTILTMTFDQEINGYHGSFKIEISGIENW
jgi:hypothetical protein